jgi:hypothetical protein
VLAVQLVLVSCDPHGNPWEGLYREYFLPGYSDTRGEVDGTDDGYVVMSYVVPAAIETAAALPMIREQIIQRHPCYSVLEQNDRLLVLRCPGGRSRAGSQWDEELRFRLAPKARRVYVLVLDEVEQPRYGQFVQSFDRVASE